MFNTYCANFRNSVKLAIGPDQAPNAKWTKSAIPTLENIEKLLHNPVRAQFKHWRVALLNGTHGSPLDTTHGHYAPFMVDISRTVPNTITAMSHAFTEIIAPLGTAHGTRKKVWRNWRTVLTWATGGKALGEILPMTPERPCSGTLPRWAVHAQPSKQSSMQSLRSTERPDFRPL